MDANQYQEAQASIANAETELAALTQTQKDCIEVARDANNRGRAARNAHSVIAAKIEPLRNECLAYVQEVKRQAAEKMKAEAAAKAKADEEARKAAEEAKAKELSEVETLRAENEALKAQLAAKG